MTAEQITKLRELEAKARTPMTLDMTMDELRGIEIARMNFRGLANQHAIPLCDALEAAQKENAELTKRVEAARDILTKAKKENELRFSPSAILEAFATALSQLNQPLP